MGCENFARICATAETLTLSSKKINVLMIVPRFGTVSRGVEVFVEELVRHIDKSRVSLYILSGPHEKAFTKVVMVQRPLILREQFKSWVIKLLSLLPSRLHLGAVEIESLSLMCKSRAFLRDTQFDVILPFGGTWSYRFARWLGHGASIIGVGHGGPVLADLSRSDFFVALTPVDQRKAEKLLPKIMSQVIPNGVDSVKFSPRIKSTASSKNIILCVGALTVDKGHEQLFDAVLKLDSSVELVCAGKGPLQDKLKEHPLYKMNRVVFVSVQHNLMPDLYRSADVFTLASSEEAFGLVFLEALACGLPVVAHDAPRQKFVIGDTGVFCNTFDTSAYAEALTRALRLPFDQRRVDHAKAFDWTLVADKYQNLMLELAEQATNRAMI